MPMELREQSKLADIIRGFNCEVWKIQAKGKKGVSDLLIGCKGKLFYLECKTYTELSKEQLDFLDYQNTFAVIIREKNFIFFKKEVKKDKILDGGEMVNIAVSVEDFIKILRS